jgi:hypothetical protein
MFETHHLVGLVDRLLGQTDVLGSDFENAPGQFMGFFLERPVWHHLIDHIQAQGLTRVQRVASVQQFLGLGEPDNPWRDEDGGTGAKADFRFTEGRIV